MVLKEHAYLLWLTYDETKSWHRPCSSSSSSRYPHSALTRDQWIVSDYRLCILRGCPLCMSMTGVTILVGGHHFLSHPVKGYNFFFHQWGGHHFWTSLYLYKFSYQVYVLQFFGHLWCNFFYSQWVQTFVVLSMEV